MFDYGSPYKTRPSTPPPGLGQGNANDPALSPSTIRSQPFIVGVAGGTASGKTAVCHSITQRLHDQCLATLNQDNFFRPLTDEQAANVAEHNFDHPAAFDEDELVRCLTKLRERQHVDVPQWCHTTHRRLPARKRISPADVVLVEGVLLLHLDRVRPLLSLKVYVDADDDTRLARRIQRDVTTRGLDVGAVLKQYTSSAKPAFDTYVAPSRKFADIIIPFGKGDNVVAIDLITEHIRMRLQQHDLKNLYCGLEVIPSNFQTRGMHTIVRDGLTSKNDFVFYADRLLRLVVEAGLGHLPFEEKTVITPTGARYVGVDYAKKLCGVSIIRSGESMENALRACCKGIKIGKILVHRERILARTATEAAAEAAARRTAGQLQGLSLNAGAGSGAAGLNGSSSSWSEPPLSAAVSDARVSSGEGGNGVPARNGPPLSTAPSGSTATSGCSTNIHGCSELEEVVYEKLPKDIGERFVLLMDPVLSTGHSAARAIQVLKERGVDESKILFLSLVAAPEGIHRICGQFPGLKLITSEIDATVNDAFQLVPGVGDFGNRYFCE